MPVNKDCEIRNPCFLIISVGDLKQLQKLFPDISRIKHSILIILNLSMLKKT